MSFELDSSSIFYFDPAIASLFGKLFRLLAFISVSFYKLINNSSELVENSILMHNEEK